MSRRQRKNSAIIQIKPLSVNQAYQGRKVKSYQYRQYEKAVLELLPDDLFVPTKGDLQVLILFGHSNSRFDYDNGIKPFQDILQTKYGFNDCRIVLAVVGKEKTAKGEEFISFKIEKNKMKFKEVIDVFN